MGNSEILQSKIRPVTKEDREKLSKFSYSGLSTYKQCPYQFDLKYNKKLVSSDTTLALELGTLLHYVLEQKGKMLTGTYAGNDSKGTVDYNILSNILQNGTTIIDEKTKEQILGLKELKKKYWEVWGVPDSEGRTYNEKIELFMKVLSDEMEKDDWKPLQFEHPFEFVYDDKIVLHGFIDRIDGKFNNGKFEGYRVVDYKTNKKLYPTKDLATSLQFGIYALAVLNEFGIVPMEYQYRMILLDQEQVALTLGWEKRLVAALDKIIKGLDERKESGKWEPNPTPLCFWCNYSGTNPEAMQYKNECQYYSLWKPTQKIFEVNKSFDEIENNKSEILKRNIVF